MPKFSEAPYFYLKDHHMSVAEQINKTYDGDHGVLVGPRTSFVTSDVRTSGITFYVKDPDYGFRPIYLKPKYEEPEDRIYFKYEPASAYKVIPSPNIISEDIGKTWIIEDDNLLNDEVINDGKVTVRFVYEGPPSVYGPTDFYIQIPNVESYPLTGDNYRFITYDYTIEDLGFSGLEEGREVYIRKDSEFHNWLKIHSNNFYEEVDGIRYTIRDYVNTDRIFIYFGKIYED